MHVCVCIALAGIVQNELICGYANVVHTSSSFRPHTHTQHTHTQHTHSPIPFEDSEPTGLKVDIAAWSPNGWLTISALRATLCAHPEISLEVKFCADKPFG